MVAIANVEMAAIWDGEEGDEWTENADRYDATDRWIARRFEAEVPIEPTDRILDIGCGTGKSTRDAARRAWSGSVLGVDLSSRMLDDARRRSEHDGLHNVEFLLADAQVHPFEPNAYDLAISVFGAMFFADPVAAFSNIRRSLRPGGRDRLPRLAALRGQRVAHRHLRRPRRRPRPADPATRFARPLRTRRSRRRHHHPARRRLRRRAAAVAHRTDVGRSRQPMTPGRSSPRWASYADSPTDSPTTSRHEP